MLCTLLQQTTKQNATFKQRHDFNTSLHEFITSKSSANMYIPSAQSVITTGLALCGMTKRKSPMYLPSPSFSYYLFSPFYHHTNLQIAGKTVSKGEILDFAVEKCIDDDANQRCSKPFLVAESTCYNIEWSTEGAVSHTTVEVKDAGSGEMVSHGGESRCRCGEESGTNVYGIGLLQGYEWRMDS